MPSEVLHVGGVLEECLWVLGLQSEVVLLVKLLVERAECLVFFTLLLCRDGRVDELVDVGRHPLITRKVDQAVDQLCVCVSV